MSFTHSLPFVSVYLITFRQKHILQETLNGLFRQKYPRELYEIIVLDDGSADGTAELLLELANCSPVSMTTLSVQHEADYLSAKRFNQCIALSSSYTEVFVHIEDVIVRPDLIWQHVKWHLLPASSLVSGAMYEADTISWDLSASDPDRKYLSTDGAPVECDFQAAWAKSLSYTKKMIDLIWKEPYDKPFDERMTGWGYHEVEFALRMKKAGARIVYDPAAGVYHPPHTKSSESYRGLEREILVSEGEEQNIAYLCRKHGLDGLDAWEEPRLIDFIDHTIWAQAEKELERYSL